MDIINVTTARKDLYKLIQKTNLNNKPIQIHGKNGNAVLISESDWREIEETLYLNAIPGMAAKLIEGMNTSDKESVSADDVEW